MGGLYLVADDLTGALDSTVPFSARYGAIRVFLDVPDEIDVEHAAVNLNTRDADPDLATRRSAGVLQHLVAAGIPFKKIDSLLRGNWSLELAALLGDGGFRSCIFAPAFPGQGRITRNGRQYVRAADHTERLVDVDPVAQMTQLGLRVSKVAPGEEPRPDMADSRSRVLVADAQSHEELRAVVRWASQLEGPTLWCGSGGLARAMARREPNRLSTVPRPLLAIIGSNHTVSQAQIAYASSWAPKRRVFADGNPARTAAAVTDAFDAYGSALLTFALAGGTTAADATLEIRKRLSALLPLLPRPKTLVVAGGETLIGVCRALGASRLDVDAEFAPGVPRSRMVDGVWQGLDIVSKSGAFGDATLLHRLLEAGAGEA